MAYQTINPFTNEVVKTYANATPEEIENALALGDERYHAWRQEPIADRAQILHRIAALMRDHKDQLAKIATIDMGKLFTESQGEVELCAMIADYYANHGADLLAPTPITTQATGDAEIEKQATGIVMAVEPWNFPYYQIMRVFAPNFMVGNPMILKHASNTPGSAAAFEQLVNEANAPRGTFKNLFLSYDQIGDIIADPRVQGVALTGSKRGGQAVAKTAGENLKKNSMELGGSDAFIVLADADIDEAVNLAWRVRLYNAGQVCTSSKRFIVADSLYDQFVAALKEKFQAMVPGDPMDDQTTLAPMNSKRAKEKLQDQVDRAIAGGATVAYGNEPIDLPGQFFQPTILTDIQPDNPLFYEEMFGPVAQVYRVADDQAAIDLANNSELGLGGIVFSGDPVHGKQVAQQIETGMVFVNTFLSSLPELPFGGVKGSGYGREMSSLGLMAFVNEKLVVTAQKPDYQNGAGGLVIL
ncbi:NAD-dependent succinate-semialdehyde dehydrogenase [Levilactobacillus brevis]|uniref:Putative succinate-semialdehyde dehydrogenase n=1 Tax=Levilactobacillus brevis ATCC 14869 = DSM 20054 TaxID=649758 RepID=U2PN33_LEVBR|nr:NAD-dependent succinate-semialdehyde dehydrogenase [Levilactobacillus brevis]ERK45531.1 putative succinate-semialdehyde dehydrogenase [Levilactobacillus brevis ATCC 14869 = DSM 20054]KIO98572.1 Succinate-semialdehyde dehydrogenase [NAD] [Levilactobacillus brevis]KRK20129.1 succinate-semialdehyde dehydrogenase NADP+ [Levilactobacillus brevis ATCC 14869 = DSM 20054]MCT3572395.1 NAD-dependent succinate-semialdehyde dehydrogenase [Levilactobacillus brevis]SQG74833.1 succinate-semialdehyde dehyd